MVNAIKVGHSYKVTGNVETRCICAVVFQAGHFVSIVEETSQNRVLVLYGASLSDVQVRQGVLHTVLHKVRKSTLRMNCEECEA